MINLLLGVLCEFVYLFLILIILLLSVLCEFDVYVVIQNWDGM